MYNEAQLKQAQERGEVCRTCGFVRRFVLDHTHKGKLVPTLGCGWRRHRRPEGRWYGFSCRHWFGREPIASERECRGE